MGGTLSESDSVAACRKGIDEADSEAGDKEHILVYAHDKNEVDNLETVLCFLGHSFKETFDLDQLKQELEQNRFLTVIVTGDLSEADQKNLIRVLSGAAPGMLPIILYKLPEKDTDALMLSYPPDWIAISLPLVNVEFSRALERVRSHVAQRNPAPKRPTHLFRSLTGRSPAIRKIRREIEQVGPTDANVLILGESGTGKEVVARNIHYHSKRRGKAFVPVNCGAIPRDLLESELFGHEKGAFTGALTARNGRFALAEGGTLFLDEIGEMPMDMQVKLLRVLEERTFERVGGSQQIKADVRIVAATNCNLENMIAENRFREDLFYRLEVFPINLPSLRDRNEDIPLLIGQLNERLEYEKSCSVDFSTQAIKALSEYSWPGNVRELANLIERLAIQYPNSLVQVHDLPAKYRGGSCSGDENELQLEFFADSRQQDASSVSEPAVPTPQIPSQGLDMKSYISEIEMKLITQALEETNGVIAHAAKLLGLRRTTLTEKMRKYGLNRPKAI
jgi:sigma-54 specific flagellar transcriptional regulator A